MNDHKTLVLMLRTIGRETQPSQRYVDRLKRYLMAHVRQDTSMRRGFWSWDVSLLYGKMVFGLCLFGLSFIGWRAVSFRSQFALDASSYNPIFSNLLQPSQESAPDTVALESQNLLQELSENLVVDDVSVSPEAVLEQHQPGVVVERQADIGQVGEFDADQSLGSQMASPTTVGSSQSPSEPRGAVVAESGSAPLSGAVLTNDARKTYVVPTPTPTITPVPTQADSSEVYIQPVTIRMQ